jgi:hypothetical protein
MGGGEVRRDPEALRVLKRAGDVHGAPGARVERRELGGQPLGTRGSGVVPEAGEHGFGANCTSQGRGNRMQGEVTRLPARCSTESSKNGAEENEQPRARLEKEGGLGCPRCSSPSRGGA